jgi:hypothetical protein
MARPATPGDQPTVGVAAQEVPAVGGFAPLRDERRVGHLGRSGHRLLLIDGFRNKNQAHTGRSQPTTPRTDAHAARTDAQSSSLASATWRFSEPGGSRRGLDQIQRLAPHLA